MFGFGEKNFKTGNVGEVAENTQRTLIATREASRTWTGRIMTLCSVIIAFSVSIFSIENFQLDTDIEQLKMSWLILLSALIVGAFNLIFESRVAYASTWVSKNTEIKSTDSVSLKDRSLAILLLSIVILYPIFASKSSTIKSSKAYLLVQNWIYDIFGFVFVFELLTFVLFIFGLLTFFHSFNL